MRKEEKEEAREFFKVAEAHSIIKSNIVSEYITGWATIIIRARKFYQQDPTVFVIDLFSGPGIYRDSVPSTPIKVLEKTLDVDLLRENVRFWFNDEFDEMTVKLQSNIELLPNIQLLKHSIDYTSKDADSPIIADWFRKNRDIHKLPMLVFIDPFGYKQLSQELLQSIITVQQSDIILFFNYKRINAALDNELFESNMNKIFGSKRVKNIKEELVNAKTSDRPAIVNRYLEESLKEIGAKFVLSFKMVTDDRDQISHYIVGLTKHEKGFELLKKVMKKHTQDAARSTSRFGYDLFSQQRGMQQDLFAAPVDPISDLAQLIVNRFQGKTLSFGAIYRTHHPTGEFTESEYKSAVRRLLQQGRATIDASSQTPSRRLPNNEQAVPDYLIINIL